MKDLRFVVLAVLGIMAAWFFTGGPERSISTSGFFLKPPSPISSGETYNNPRGIFLGEGGIFGGIGGSIRGASDEAAKIRADINDAARFGEVSPYKGKISIERSTAGIVTSDAAREYVTITASHANSAPISVTGWRLENEDRTNAAIGRGFPLPKTGVVSTEGAIMLAPGARAHISTGRSPIGASFRTNKCTGYFEQFQDFTPALDTRCPLPANELDLAPDLNTFDDACVSFVKSVGQCRIHIGNTPTVFKDACYTFLVTKLTYVGCVGNHEDDQDFYENEWRIFLGRDAELWKKERGSVRLLDENGKTVDLYPY